MSYRKPEQWLEVINEQQASGLSAVAFCKNNNINPKYFSHQKNKLMPNKNAFIKATPIEQPCDSNITIICGDVTVQLPAITSPQWISECIKALN